MEKKSDYLEKSKVFLEEAKDTLKKRIHWLTCFHAHQSVEFYIKGILEDKVGSYPFTHDLTLLLKTLSSVLNTDPPEDIKIKTEALSPHYTLSRYGGLGVAEYDEDKAIACLRYAEEILKWLRSII